MVERVGGVLRRTITRRERHDTGGPNVSYHLQCGGGHSGTPLGVNGSGRNGGYNSNDDKAGKTTKGRTIQGRDNMRRRAEEGNTRLKVKSSFLCRQQDGSLHQTGVAPYCVQNSDGALQLGGTAYKLSENCGHGLTTIPGFEQTRPTKVL